MKKTILLGVVIVLVISLALAIILFLKGEKNTWLCQNGAWVKQGNPSVAAPASGCGLESASLDDLIKADQPKINAQVSSPVTVSGQARGSWYFEASFPVKLLDANGKVLAEAPAQARGDWMVTDYVPFTVDLSFDRPLTATGKLILQKDNPSGLPQNDASLEIPVIFNQEQMVRLKVYFTTPQTAIEPNFDCGEVGAVVRTVPKTQAVARAALEQLLLGPTEAEKQKGFSTSINSGVKIQSLSIQDGIARVDFNNQLQYQVGGSCRIGAIRSQIINTLKQFDTIKDVVISIGGETEDILQP